MDSPEPPAHDESVDVLIVSHPPPLHERETTFNTRECWYDEEARVPKFELGCDNFVRNHWRLLFSFFEIIKNNKILSVEYIVALHLLLHSDYNGRICNCQMNLWLSWCLQILIGERMDALKWYKKPNTQKRPLAKANRSESESGHWRTSNTSAGAKLRQSVLAIMRYGH